MTYQEFQGTLLDNIKASFSASTQVQIKQITKNNNFKLDSLIISEEGCNISPTIYINFYYHQYLQGSSIEQICSDIYDMYQSNRIEEEVDISAFFDFARISHQIVYKLVNYEKNQELLADIPYIPYLDLAVVFSYLIDLRDASSASILIHNSHLNYWDITLEELRECAEENTPQLLAPDLRDMRDMMESDFNEELPPDTEHMYILTNTKKLHGASCILYQNLLDDFARIMNRDLFVIPSSIHEVLLVPVTQEHSMEEFTDMVREVNMTQVAPEEILSDHVYYYNKEEHTLTY